MAVETPADRASLVDPDEFGDSGLIAPVGGGAAYAVDGILDVPHEPESIGIGVEVSLRRPTFLLADEVLQNVSRGDVLTIAGHPPYKVADWQPDGTGFTELLLGE